MPDRVNKGERPGWAKTTSIRRWCCASAGRQARPSICWSGNTSTSWSASSGAISNDWSECQDVTQEAFIRAYRAIGAFRGDSQFYTWVYKIAINTAKNWLVSQGRRPPTDDIAVEDAVLFDGSTRLRESATPERELLREEIERTVFATVESLPEELRTAITLREVDGLSYEEIAEAMSCPIGTVRSRIFRAREAIDETLRPLLSEQE